MPSQRISPDDIEVIAPNLGRRYSGVTSTIERVVPHQARDLPIATIGMTISPSLPRLLFRDIWRLWRRPKRVPFRIWHARRNDDLLLGLFLRDVLRMPLKLIFTSASQRKHSPITRFLLKRVDAIIATSPESSAYLSRPNIIIPHGMDTDTYAPSPDRAALRARLGLPDALLIGCFGRIRPDKGTFVFADAWIGIANKFADATGIVTGLTKPRYASFERSILDKVAENNLSDRFMWLGEQPASRMPEMFRALDIYVAPQRWEGFGVTPLEAMASGVPVVATTVGTFNSQIVDGLTGILVPPNDPAALQAAMERLARDPELRRRMGAAGRERVQSLFSISREASEINLVYEELWNTAMSRDSTPDAPEAKSRRGNGGEV